MTQRKGNKAKTRERHCNRYAERERGRMDGKKDKEIRNEEVTCERIERETEVMQRGEKNEVCDVTCSGKEEGR